ncbi:hypothetical protein R6Y94_05290 [Plantactinospora sp. KLBMP9567]|nr:hypothetical protein [Plantactinospora sp. KLBMP9567]MDW5323256.1 hypothetical protein [Plantactinospora sp. KLBMP9567]
MIVQPCRRPAGGAPQSVLCGAQLRQPRAEQEGRLVVDPVRRADPVAVPGAQVLVVGEQPPHLAALMPSGAAGTGTLGQVTQAAPRRRRNPQLGQRPGQSNGLVAGDGRKPAQRGSGGVDVPEAPLDADVLGQRAAGQSVH